MSGVCGKPSNAAAYRRWPTFSPRTSPGGPSRRMANPSAARRSSRSFDPPARLRCRRSGCSTGRGDDVPWRRNIDQTTEPRRPCGCYTASRARGLSRQSASTTRRRPAAFPRVLLRASRAGAAMPRAPRTGGSHSKTERVGASREPEGSTSRRSLRGSPAGLGTGAGTRRGRCGPSCRAPSWRRARGWARGADGRRGRSGGGGRGPRGGAASRR